MSSVIVGAGRRRYAELPKPPPDMSTAVELFARKSGRTGTLHFVPFGGWFVRLSLRPDDKRMTLWRDGKAQEPPSEDIWLHRANPRYGQMVLGTQQREPRFHPISLGSLGVAGIIDFLELGDTSTGRGEFGSVEEAVTSARVANQDMRQKNQADSREKSRHKSRGRRRTIFGIPYLTVDIDLKKKEKVKQA